MICRWLIFSSALLVAAAGAQAAAVSGSVRLADSRIPGVQKHNNYSGVVVWLEPVGAQPVKYERALPMARMEQRGKHFIPHVIAIPSGASVQFPNADPVFHNVFSNFSGQVFDLGLYPPGTSRTVHFTRPGVVHVFCNIHPAMSAIIVVTPTPFLTVSNSSGAFTIDGVPPGEYRLRVFHERATQKTLAALERTITVAAAGLTLRPITVSETGWVEAPHKNKYGHDYPPAVDDPDAYGGH